MRVTVSISRSRICGLKAVCEVAGVARSGVYAERRAGVIAFPSRRGPKTAYTDSELVEQVRATLAASPFVGEGYRKVWARLRHRGIRTSKARILRLMRAHGLQAPTRLGAAHGPRIHDGTIIPPAPNQRWGTDLTSTWTVQEAQASVLLALDHCTAEIVGIHAAKRATRWEALEPIRQGVRAYFGNVKANVAAGLELRHDHGSQYVSDDFQSEIAFLGILSSPSYVREPEGNGCVERAIRTLKEQLLWVKSFDTVEELRVAVIAWAKLYNERWLIERHGFKSPAQARREHYVADPAAAA